MSAENDAINIVQATGKSYNLRKEVNGMDKRSVKYHENDNYDSDSEVDDLIILNGFRVRTEWRFPEDITCCPMPSCGLEFGSRLAAIDHYKGKHANQFIFCSFCEKPISTKNFLRHYRKIHPDNDVPSFASEKISRSTDEVVHEQEVNESMDDDNARDDLITLNRCGIQTYWKFPEGITRCPVVRCDFSSDEHAEVMTHYQEKHANRSILCEICYKPICCDGRKDFRNHFRRIHPHVKVPHGFGFCGAKNTNKQKANKIPAKNNKKKNANIRGERKRCGYCNKIVLAKNYQRHLSDVHGSQRIKCPLIGCEYTAQKVYTVRQHWSKEHPSLRFPDIRMGTFIYKRAPKNTNVRQEISALSAQLNEIATKISLLTPPPYEETGDGFLTDLSDLVSDDESIFSDDADDNSSSEVNGGASSGAALNRSADVEMHSEGRQSRFHFMEQIDSPNPVDNQAQSHEFVLASNSESTFHFNTENQTTSTSDGELNGQKQQTPAVLGQSDAPNQSGHQSETAIQDEKLLTSSCPAIKSSTEDDSILISDDDEVYEISDDSDDEINNNADDAMQKEGHVRAFKIDKEPQVKMNGELDGTLPATLQPVNVSQVPNKNDVTMNELNDATPFDWSLLQD